MDPVTDRQIRSSFVNASRREANDAPLPPGFPDLAWDELEFLGWRDPKSPRRAYAVVPTDDGLVGFLLRTASSGAQRVTMCDWCADVKETDDVVLYVAKRAGASGKQGNTLGALLHADLSCCTHVRRRPTPEEAAGDAAGFVARRVARLSEQVTRFAARLQE